MNFSKIKSVLFVCTGNSCRSPMAEGFFKSIVNDDIKTASAGVSCYAGYEPASDAIEVMKENNIDISNYRSQRVSQKLVHDYDLIIVMQETHRAVLLNMFPEIKAKIYLLKEFYENLDKEDSKEIADPIGRNIKYYRECFNEIKNSVIGIVKKMSS